MRLKENEEEIYEPNGPNLNIQGTGVELTVGSHNEEDMYGVIITNNTAFPVFPYLFYFDSSNFSISTHSSLRAVLTCSNLTSTQS